MRPVRRNGAVAVVVPESSFGELRTTSQSGKVPVFDATGRGIRRNPTSGGTNTMTSTAQSMGNGGKTMFNLFDYRLQKTLCLYDGRRLLAKAKKTGSGYWLVTGYGVSFLNPIARKPNIAGRVDATRCAVENKHVARSLLEELQPSTQQGKTNV